MLNNWRDMFGDEEVEGKEEAGDGEYMEDYWKLWKGIL
jgi:hypothetical protein